MSDVGIFIVTNGKRTKDALRLANLARKGVIGCDLSQDMWHDPIDPEVYTAFTEGRKTTRFGHGSERDLDLRGIRDVSESEELGLWRDPEEGGDWAHCACDSHVIKPNGQIHLCGCHDAPVIGNVWDGIDCEKFMDLLDFSCYHTYLYEVEGYTPSDEDDNE